MKLKKDLAMLVKTDFVPLQADKEGSLRGGFGTMITSVVDVKPKVNVPCKNYTCKNGECANPSCANQCANPTCANHCTINYCATPSPTTSPSPSPATAAAPSAILLGF